MKKAIVLVFTIIMVIPFVILIIGAMDAMSEGTKFENTLLGNLIND